MPNDSGEQAQPAPKMDVSQLKKLLKSNEARWQAEHQGEHRLGYTPGPEDEPFERREARAQANLRTFKATKFIAGPPYPNDIDWRNYAPHPGGPSLPKGNYVTPIRDQATCGSCVAFGSVAAIESAEAIKAKTINPSIDLSEADLFYCHGGIPPGPTCEAGWYPDAALNVCKTTGIVDEQCFPYTPGNQPCRRCANWSARLHKITSWRKISGTTDMKSALANEGPLITCMSVYADFQYYRSGIYHHVSGGFDGGHCICCVGYDDSSRFWICKNSWGSGWGEKGFFRIGYGECGIDATMWQATV